MHQRSAALAQHTRGETGAGLVEYSLLLALIAVVCLSAVSFFGNGGKGMMANNAGCVGSAMGDTSQPCVVNGN